MKTLLGSLFIFTTLLIQGCIQAPSNTRKSSVATSATTTTTTTATSPTFATDEILYWFNTAKVLGTVTINKNSADIIYLRGKLVHDFLTSKDSSGSEYYRKQYCLVGNFSTATYKQVRVRAVPIFVTTSTKAIERLLRIDIPSSSDNSSACNNTNIDSIIPSLAAYSLPEICPTCTGQVTTSTLSLYQVSTTPASLTVIPTAKINLSSTLLRIDLTSNSTSSSGSCTNSSCEAKGFDCCISGQCVQDGSEKANASIDPQYAQAKNEYASNSLSFINYPNIFYICSNISHVPTPTPVVTTTPVGTAQTRVAKYLADYTCTNEAAISGTYLTCRNLNSSGVATAIDKTLAAYTAIKKKLAVACGCTASDDQMSLKCPDWGIIPVYLAGAPKTNANITDFACYTPQPSGQIGPIVNLNVNVPNRSAPHRFYSSVGMAYDDLTGLITKFPNLIQENGNAIATDDDFHYLDEYNKMGPVNGSYNVNSVLGKMSIDLNHTLPAKEVNVELGKTYILTATSGYFTPCSQCAKDSWFQTFSPHPNTLRGVGLQASGYTTSRDTYSANSTFGNYEDTKFGRACYVPVTMLPLAHQKNADLALQRKNRLRTQAAFYINGYQRDWYGFNKGALIGSFDGVTWFAIGSGRRATATSTKLYLALNAAFLDLADKTDTIVNIIPDLSSNIAPDFDYNPDLALTDPHQNTAATCQKFHQCEADADCVSQLGWEYACADVSQLKTKWPQYDSEGQETANQEKSGSIFELIVNPLNTTSTKRCVYRGQGAPCKRDYTNINDNIKKNLTCAPNFYCASLNASKFNDELVRSPNEFDDIFFGMDANVLGRPLKYVTANKTLNNEIISNIQYNASSAIGIDSSDMGICRPGKKLTDNNLDAHGNPDTGKRTDYISQIGSCDSTKAGEARFYSCPAFDDTLNYINTNTAADKLVRETQNACGAESKLTGGTVSAFKFIEGLSLINTQTITQPTLAQDACFRRAGSVCHTDLDCGPNKMHEDAASTVNLNYFGGTEAEQKYWQESLICGQEKAVPTFGSAGYFDYKLSENRCCREIGKDFTMFTEGNKTLIPENSGSNELLKTALFPDKGPNIAKRYSRYTISKTALEDPTKIPAIPSVAPLEPAQKQWQVINETGSLTCCGGGWIRKFADGSHDWKVRNRLSIEASNFTCLNYRSPLVDSNYSSFVADKIVASSYQREYENFCKFHQEKGCFQIEYPESNEFLITSPVAYNPFKHILMENNDPAPLAGFARINTSLYEATGFSGALQSKSVDSPYLPIGFNFPNNDTVNPDARSNKPENYFFVYNSIPSPGVAFYLPAYVAFEALADNSNSNIMPNVYIKYEYPAPVSPQSKYVLATPADPTECTNVLNITQTPDPITHIRPSPFVVMSTPNTYCVVSNVKTGMRPVFFAKSNTADPIAWSSAGIIIDFKTVEKVKNTKISEAGNAMYYLSKLGRLELLGIPQITYEPLYCNNNQNSLVPGIFKTLKTRADFIGASNSYTTANSLQSYINDGDTTATSTVDVAGSGYGNEEKKFTYQDKIDHPAVFSSNNFTCCTPLGKQTTSATKCCAGAATTTDGKVYTCKMPKGTDLNVFFNKFVSSEGVGDAQPGGGLTIKGTATEEDFNAYTGEPKFRTSTYNKLKALGEAYCDGTVEVGGAFGNFPPEPFSGTYSTIFSTPLEDSFPLSIVDSIVDEDPVDVNLGKRPFDLGFKWNHHLYCK